MKLIRKMKLKKSSEIMCYYKQVFISGFDINELLIELIDQNEVKSYAQYAAFSIGPYSQGHPLKVLGGYTGDAGDSLSYHAGSKFSTKDLDLDSWTEGSCALSHSMYKVTFFASF